MKIGTKIPYYGKLNVKDLDQRIYRIWLTRNDELPFCEPSGWSWEQENDPEDSRITRDYIHKLIKLTPMNDQQELVIQLVVLEGCTLEETGLELKVSLSRVQQILRVVLSKLRNRWGQLN